jgi:hypothetical protein
LCFLERIAIIYYIYKKGGVKSDDLRFISFKEGSKGNLRFPSFLVKRKRSIKMKKVKKKNKKKKEVVLKQYSSFK